MDLITHLRTSSLESIRNCITIVRNEASSYDVVVIRLESLADAIRAASEEQYVPWAQEALRILDVVVNVLLDEIDGFQYQSPRVGRPRLPISTSLIEFLLSIKFKVVDIAKILGVSRGTVFGRMHSVGISVSRSI